MYIYVYIIYICIYIIYIIILVTTYITFLAWPVEHSLVHWCQQYITVHHVPK